ILWLSWAISDSYSKSEIESVYVFARPDYSFLSSTGVKEMATFGADISDLVPAPVAAALADRLERDRK
ncbi:MAG: pantetheine-phosphate adenylyltransferase, partial [Solirubrobacterales bacterium]